LLADHRADWLIAISFASDFYSLRFRSSRG
jgi:hypothetical protein